MVVDESGLEETRDLDTPPADTFESHPAEDAAPSDRDVTGLRIGRYRIVGKLGKGGMGVVYDAHDETLDRPVALKLMLPDSHRSTIARFQREAQALAQLSHPNVVQVYETGLHQGQLFIAMERIDGVTLRRWLGQTERSVEEIGQVILAAGQGLAAAHAVGMVHRDFKPGNVLVGHDGRVRVVDFGLARPEQGGGSRTDGETPYPSGPSQTPSPALAELTETGVLMGTPAYMAPELLEWGEATVASDQFALCVTAYEAWYGQRPFAGRTVRQLAMSLRNGLPPPPASSRVPTSIHQVLEQGLAFKPQQRFPSIDALLLALRRSQHGRRRWVWATSAAATATIVAALAWPSPSEHGPCNPPGGDLDQVWDADDKAAVASAFESTALPYAATTSQRVGVELDEYAEQWSSTRSDLCEAWTAQRIETRTFDVRLHCLNEGRRALSELVPLLTAAEPEVVEHAHDLTVNTLAAPSACIDAATQGPTPETAPAREALERHRDRLARIKLLRVGHQVERATAEIEGGRADAEATGLPQPPLDLSLEQGRLQVHAGSYDDALQTFESSYFAAREHGLDALAYAAAAQLAELHAVERNHPDDGEPWLEHAIAVVDPERQPEHEAWEAQVRGTIAQTRGQYEESETLYRRSLELAEARHGSDHSTLVRPLNDLIAVLQKRGRFEEALEASSRAQQLVQTNLGDQHPIVAQILINEGGVHVAQGHFEPARTQLEQALAILLATRGKEHPDIIPVLNNLALCDFQRGEFERARTHLERVVELGPRVLGEDQPVVAGAQMHLGNLDFAARDYEGAVRRFERALAGMEAAMGPEHPAITKPLANMAQALSQLERHDEARARALRALNITEATLGTEHSEYAAALHTLAMADLGAGNLPAARDGIERSIALWLETVGPEHPHLRGAYGLQADIAQQQGRHEDRVEALRRVLALDEARTGHGTSAGLGRLALAELDLGRRSEARTHADMAFDRATADGSPTTMANARFVLAQVLAVGGDGAEARRLAALARDAYRSAGPGYDHELAEVEAWLGSAGRSRSPSR
ncbi:MAG: serine/threonine-protein kinase [Myxococcota bacterium]